MALPSSLAARRLGALASINTHSKELARLLRVDPPVEARHSRQPGLREVWTLESIAAFLQRAAESPMGSEEAAPKRKRQSA